MIMFRSDTDRLELMTAAQRFTPELTERKRDINEDLEFENNKGAT